MRALSLIADADFAAFHTVTLHCLEITIPREISAGSFRNFSDPLLAATVKDRVLFHPLETKLTRWTTHGNVKVSVIAYVYFVLSYYELTSTAINRSSYTLWTNLIFCTPIYVYFSLLEVSAASS